MKAEKWIFVFIGVFFAVVTPIYWFAAHEVAGALALLLAGVFGFMVAGYLAITARSIDKRPEDDVDGEVVHAAGQVGFFPPKSVWPFWTALTIAIIVLGPVFGWWISLLGVGIGIWALCGWVFEFYRGDYKH